MSKETTLCRPALFTGPCFLDDEYWLWVRMSELAEIIGQEPIQLWENFKALWYQAANTAIPPAWHIAGEQAGTIEESCNTGGMPDFRREVMVTAGYANNVLRAHSIGVERLETLEHEISTEHDKLHEEWGGCPNKPLLQFSAEPYTETKSLCVIGFDSRGQQIWLEEIGKWKKLPTRAGIQPQGKRLPRAFC